MQPDIDPVAFSIGPISVHWYGLMYLVGFVGGYWLGVHRARSTPGWDKEQVSDLLFKIAVGVIVGGRMGYVLFYKANYYFSHPLEIFYVWQGGDVVSWWVTGRPGCSFAVCPKYAKVISSSH